MDTLSEQELISRYQNGNENALEILLKRYQKEIFTYIYYKVNDDSLANDIFQDTFIKIILTLKKGKYKEEGKFILWAKRISHNLIIDHYRLETKKRLRTKSSLQVDSGCIFDKIASEEKNQEEIFIDMQIHQDLHKLLEQLPQNQQEVIQLRFFLGLSFKEIAEQTNVSINTTLGRVRYALMNLRKIIEENKISMTK